MRLSDFWSWTELNPVSGCLLWTGGCSPYGVLSLDGLYRYAHRVAYEIARGPIPAGLQIDHLCRTPACVNPDHLEAVTVSENVRRGIRARAAGATRQPPR